MESFKLRVRIGSDAFEFEAEGEREAVERQFEAFRGFTRTATPPKGPRGLPAGQESTDPDNATTPPLDGASGDSPDAAYFGAIYRVDNDVVFLSALPEGAERISETGLLLLFGYRLYRHTDEVSGADLMASMSRSGFTVERADRVLDRYIGGVEALVMKYGQKRGTKYRLTGRGLTAAREKAVELRTMVG